MRITFILPTATMGGGTRVVAIYAEELSKRGHEVVLISLPSQQLPLKEKIKGWLRGGGWTPAVASHLDGLRLNHRILDVWRPITDEDVPDADIVVATWWETAEWVNALRPTKGIKVYFIQGHEVFPYLPAERSRATYHLPLHKIVVSRWLQHIMSSEYRDSSVDLVPNSVDHAQFFAISRDKQAAPTVGFLYSHATTKGLDVLMSALGSVRKTFPGMKFVAFGSEQPPDQAIPEGTEFLHRPPQDQIRNIYARCDVWVTASRSEGFNLPAMEAMACRTPVVSTRTGWPEEAIKTGWNGVLVDIDDVEGLVRGVEWVLSQTNDAWKILSANALATVAESSWNVSAAMFEKALVNAQSRASRGEIAGGSSLIRT